MGCGCNKKKEAKDLISRIQNKIAANATKPNPQTVKNLPVAPGEKKQAPKKK